MNKPAQFDHSDIEAHVPGFQRLQVHCTM